MKSTFTYQNSSIYAVVCDEIGATPPTVHRNIEIIYMLDGSFDIEINGINYHLESGDLCLTFPFMIHNTPQKRVKFLLIGFDPDWVQNFSHIFQSKIPISPCLLKADIPQILPKMFRKVVDISTKKPPFYNEMIQGYLSVILGELLSILSFTEIESQKISTMQEILIYCSTNFRNKISLKQISDDLYISPNHISAIFSKKLKISLRRYINNLRINEAMRLLTNTEMEIIDVMLECGFTNQSTFNKVFMEFCGITPRQFKKLSKSTLSL